VDDELLVLFVVLLLLLLLLRFDEILDDVRGDGDVNDREIVFRLWLSLSSSHEVGFLCFFFFVVVMSCLNSSFIELVFFSTFFLIHLLSFDDFKSETLKDEDTDDDDEDSRQQESDIEDVDAMDDVDADLDDLLDVRDK
jgi:hypothetical protein